MVSYVPAIASITAPALGFVPVKSWIYLIDKNDLDRDDTLNTENDSFLWQMLRYIMD